MDIVTLSCQRYTAKAYDANKKIPPEQLKQLCALLRNCPSSVNSQPWHFIVVHQQESKEKILPAIMEINHARVRDASHVVVFCARKEMSEAHLQRLLAQEEQDGRFINEEAKQGQDAGRRYFIGLNSSSPESLLAWESKQVYIALSALLFGAAALGIDSTPIEGFDTKKLDEVLDLTSHGLTSVVIASLGYHSQDDFNVKLGKSRLAENELFTFL